MKTAYQKTLDNLIEFWITLIAFKVLFMVLGISERVDFLQQFIELAIVGIFRFAMPILLVRLLVVFYKAPSEADLSFKEKIFWPMILGGAGPYVLYNIVHIKSMLEFIVRFTVGLEFL